MKEKHKKKLDEIRQDNRDFRAEITERVTFQNDNISSVKSDIDKSLVIFGFIIAVILFVAGYVVNSYLVETQKLKKDVEVLLSQTRESEKTVKVLKSEIDSNTNSLYKKLQKEEIDYITEILEKTPDDLEYYFSKIVRSSNLKSIHYNKLKKMYALADRQNKVLYKNLMFSVAPEKAFLETDFFDKIPKIDMISIHTITGSKRLPSEFILRIVDTTFNKLTYDQIINSVSLDYLVGILNICNSYPCNYKNRIQIVSENLNSNELFKFHEVLKNYNKTLPFTNAFDRYIENKKA